MLNTILYFAFYNVRIHYKMASYVNKLFFPLILHATLRRKKLNYLMILCEIYEWSKMR